MKRVLLFSHDPGGANVIIPLVKPLLDLGHEVLLYGKDIALDKYQAEGIVTAVNITDELSEPTIVSISLWITKLAPDYIITGTSASDITEKLIWKAAESVGIPTFVILDSWIDYRLRFSKYTIGERDLYDKNRELDYLPSKIFTMDDYAKREMIKEGIPVELIEITGHPYFDYLRDKALSLPNPDKKGHNETIIAFISQPLIEIYGFSDGVPYWGYTEKEIFQHLIDALFVVYGEKSGKVKLVVRPHPKEKVDEWLKEAEVHSCDWLDIYIDKETDQLSLMMNSDVIAGMFSTFLIESVVLNKPTVSIQIGLNKENPFVLDKINVLKSAGSQEELVERLRNSKENVNDFKLTSNSVSNIISITERIV